MGIARTLSKAALTIIGAGSGPLTLYASQLGAQASVSLLQTGIAYLSSLGGNLLAAQLGDLVNEPSSARHGRGLQRAVAQAIANAFVWSDDAPGPLQRRIQLSFERAPLRAQFERWREPFMAAIASEDDQMLDALFKDQTDADCLELAHEHLLDSSIWSQFFDRMVVRAAPDMRLNSAALKIAVVSGLPAVFPHELSSVLLSPEHHDSWLAYQRAVFDRLVKNLQLQERSDRSLERVLLELSRRLDEFVSHQIRHISMVGVPCLSPDRAAERVITEWWTEIDRRLRREHHPLLDIPTSASTDQGVAALRFHAGLVREVIGRESEMKRLGQFLDHTRQFLWWGMVGEGGTGKSRLGWHFAQQARARGWDAGFLLIGHWLNEGVRKWIPEQPTLIVIDYAAAGSQHLVSALAVLQSRMELFPHVVRVLLLDRRGALGPLFSELIARSESASTRHLELARESLFNEKEADTSVPIHGEATSPLGTSDAQRGRDRYQFTEADFLILDVLAREHWNTILARVLSTRGINRPLPPHGHSFWNAVERMSDEGKPLLLMSIGNYLEADGESFSLDERGRDEWLGHILAGERAKHWKVIAGAEEWSANAYRYECAIVLATLTRGLDLTDERTNQILRSVVELEGEAFRRFRARLTVILRPQNSIGRRMVLRPLEPDIFGEYLLQEGARQNDYGETELDFRRILSAGFEIDQRRCAEALSLTATDFPAAVLPWLQAAFSMLSDHALPAQTVDAATQSPLLTLCEALGSSSFGHGAVNAIQFEPLLREVAGRSEENRYGIVFGLLSIQHRISDGAREELFRLVFELSTSSSASIELSRVFMVGCIYPMEQFGRTERFAELELWGQQMAILESRYADEEIARAATAGAAVAIGEYGSAGRFDDLERWANRLRVSSSGRTDELSFVLEHIKSTAKSMDCYGSRQRFDDLERWATGLSDLSSALVNEPEMLAYVLTGAVCAIKHYVYVQNAVGVTRWVDWLADLDDRFNLTPKARRQVMDMALSLMARDCSERRFETVKIWYRILWAHGEGLAEDRDVAVLLARGAVNALAASVSTGSIDVLDEVAGIVQALRARHPNDRDVAMVFAGTAVNALSWYANTDSPEAMEQWWARLESVVVEHGGDPEVVAALAKGIRCLMRFQRRMQPYQSPEANLTRLQKLLVDHPDKLDIAVEFANAATDAVLFYATQREQAESERWLDCLRRLEKKWPYFRQLSYSLGEALVPYGVMHLWQACSAEFERINAELRGIWLRYPDDQVIAVNFATASVNAVFYYGKRGELSDTERWCSQVMKIQEQAPANHEIADLAARALLAMIDEYNTLGRVDDVEKHLACLESLYSQYLDDAPVTLSMAKGALLATHSQEIHGRADSALRTATVLDTTCRRLVTKMYVPQTVEGLEQILRRAFHYAGDVAAIRQVILGWLQEESGFYEVVGYMLRDRLAQDGSG